MPWRQPTSQPGGAHVRVDAHKWTQAVRVVAGSPGMTGAASLASVAAMRAGAGIVWLSTPGETAPRSELIEVVGKPCPAERVGRRR